MVPFVRSSAALSRAPALRLRTLFEGPGLRARLGWYAPGQRMARHAHAQHQFSILLGGTLGESAAGEDLRIAGPAVGFKAAGLDHANDYGPAGALIFGVELEASPRSEDARRTMDWRWRAAPSAVLLRHSRALLDDLITGVDADPESRLWELVAAITDSGGTAAGGKGQPPRWLARVSARLQEEATPLADLARDEGLHPVYVSRAFLRWNGCTPSTQRIRARLQRALAALSAGRSLVESALLAGFSDHAHFSRTARAHVGLSPRQLRTVLG